MKVVSPPSAVRFELIRIQGYLAHKKTPLTILIVDVTVQSHSGGAYRGTTLTRKCTTLGHYRRPMPRVLGVS